MRDLSKAIDLHRVLFCACCNQAIHRPEDAEVCSYRNFLVVSHKACVEEKLLRLKEKG